MCLIKDIVEEQELLDTHSSNMFSMKRMSSVLQCIKINCEGHRKSQLMYVENSGYVSKITQQ